MTDIRLSKPRSLKSSGALGPVRDVLAHLRGWQGAFVAAVFGAVGNLAYAPFNLVAALSVSLVGLIWMMDGARREPRWGRAVFFRVFAFGFGHFAVGLHWIANAFAQVQGAMAFVWLAVLVLPAILALVWAVLLTMSAAFWSSSPSRIFVFTLFLAMAEWLRGTLFGGLPWNLPATAWVPGGAVSQVASIGGVYWLTLLTVFLLASPAALSDDREGSGLAGRAMPLLAGAIALALGWTWGAQRLQASPVMSERHVVLIDAGIPPGNKHAIAPEEQVRRYLELLEAAPGDPSDIVIWPESPISTKVIADGSAWGRPLGLIEWPDALDALAVYLEGRTLITGSIQWVNGWQGPAYNVLAVIEGESARLGPKVLYQKHRLVPLGELAMVNFIPFGERLAGLLPASLQDMAKDGFTPGPGPEFISTEKVPPFVPLICYEVLFPEISRSQAANAQWLVNISLDGWFGSGVGPLQHYDQARYRAIETGLPLARSASRGVTAMVDPYGRETARGAIQAGDPEGWRSSMVRAPIPAAIEPPPFRRYGMAFFWISVVACAVLAFVAWRR